MIIVLWVLFLLSAFALTLSQVVRQKLALSGRLQQRDKLHYICEAGVKKAISELKGLEFKGFDTLADYWADNASLFSNIPVGDGSFSVSYEYFDDISSSRTVKYGLIDEERKININKADPATLERLFRIVLNMEEQEAGDLSASVIDWRDSDNTSPGASGGAEDSYYTSLPSSYEAKDADFQVPGEILLVKGMDKVIFEKLKDYITIYGDGKVNVNTASRIALMALGLSPELADKIVVFRCGEDNALGTADDKAFDTAAGIAPAISQSFDLSPAQLAELSTVAAEKLGVASNYFTIISTARLENRKGTQTATCVANREGRALYWQEN